MAHGTSAISIGDLHDYIYRGKPATDTCLIACAWSGDTQVELIRPVRVIRSTTSISKSAARGFTISSCSMPTEEGRHRSPRGHPVFQSGRYDEDEHDYIDTEKDFGYILEGNAGKIRPAYGGSQPEAATA